MTEEEFNKKIVELNNKDVIPIIKTDTIINKFTNLFWLEKTLNMKRLDINNIEITDLNNIKKIFISNIEKLYWFFVTNESKSKTIKNIKNKIEKIKNVNLLQKFIANCYNSCVEEIIEIKIKKIHLKKVFSHNEYVFTIKK